MRYQGDATYTISISHIAHSIINLLATKYMQATRENVYLYYLHPSPVISPSLIKPLISPLNKIPRRPWRAKLQQLLEIRRPVTRDRVPTLGRIPASEWHNRRWQLRVGIDARAARRAAVCDIVQALVADQVDPGVEEAKGW
jgi:hypothetical protein